MLDAVVQTYSISTCDYCRNPKCRGLKQTICIHKIPKVPNVNYAKLIVFYMILYVAILNYIIVIIHMDALQAKVELH